MRYVNTSNAEQYVPRIEKVVGPGETVESEFELSGPFVPIRKERLPANPEDVN